MPFKSMSSIFYPQLFFQMPVVFPGQMELSRGLVLGRLCQKTVFVSIFSLNLSENHLHVLPFSTLELLQLNKSYFPELLM